jgi:hypothetical protein
MKTAGEQEIPKEVVIDRKMPCQITFEVNERVFKGTSMHFNERGMLVMCKNPAPLNSRGKITLLFPGFKNPVELTAEVVWTNIYGVGDSLCPKGMGVKFVQIEREMARMIAELATQYESHGSIYSCYYS